MTILRLSLLVLCAIACNVQAQFRPGFPGSTGPTFPQPPRPYYPGSNGWPPRTPGYPQLPPTFPRPGAPPPYIHRLRRESPEQPQGSLEVRAEHGSGRDPSVDVNYRHPIINDDRTKLDAYGGANFQRGEITPHAGVAYEHRFDNDVFIRGQGDVQPGPRGGLSPTFNAGVGWRFRRELPEEQLDF